MIKQKIVNCLFVALLMPVSNFAQSFKYQASLSPATKDGFYAITMIPALTAYLQPDFRDLRLVSKDGVFVPYIIKQSTSAPDPQAPYRAFTIISQSSSDSITTLLLDNATAQSIDNISLEINNAFAERIASLSGSNSQALWYTLIDQFAINQHYSTTGNSYTENISVPTNNYRYLKIVIHNQKNDPLNIRKAGTFTSTLPVALSDFQENPPVHFTQKDSAGSSYYFFSESTPYIIDRVTVRVKGPKFFSRVLTIYTKNHSEDYTIKTDSVFNLATHSFKEGKWIFSVQNGDNPPLQISGVTTSQRVNIIIAYLEKDKTYHLEMGNASATIPVYDLVQFADSIPSNLPSLSISEINPKTGTSSSVPPSGSIWNKAWLWVILGAILILLSVFTIKLVKEMNEKKG
ncbi:MAG: hypothetical protein J0I41_18410 [Filimonas sp.]|nr:hypothetical protein [Filimonas sp.]